MPIEIRELIIKATVTNADEEETNTNSSSAIDNEDSCAEPGQIATAIAEILKRKNER